MPHPKKAQALTQIRNAYLRLEFLLCLGEIDDKWCEDFLLASKKKLGKALKTLEPKRRLPSVLKDTKLGRAIAAERKKCTHKWGATRRSPFGLSRTAQNWEICRKCRSYRFSPSA